jgi:glucose/arabinose dehydrogenase
MPRQIAGACVLAAILAALAASPSPAQERSVKAGIGNLRVETVASGLNHPWGMAFLPDGRMLVTERVGTLRIVDKNGLVSRPLQGVPPVFAERQGGLLDVALDPDFGSSRLVYLTYAEPGEGGASTAAGRGRLGENGLEGFQRIFQQQPKVDGGLHFGSRLAFARDGNLFITLGERFKFDPAQDLSNHLGAIVRIRPDGSVPNDNPFVGREKARPEIWSYGHRNVQGAAIHPERDELWAHEMGPRGGDELNVVEAGGNYGWPIVSWGSHYDGGDIPDPPTRPEFAGSVRHWDPVISPSGMIFYTGNMIPKWRGSALIGGLTARGIVRVQLDGRKATGEERLSLGVRIRDVEQGPDGAVYALTDEANGKVLRLTPGD